MHLKSLIGFVSADVFTTTYHSRFCSWNRAAFYHVLARGCPPIYALIDSIRIIYNNNEDPVERLGNVAALVRRPEEEEGRDLARERLKLCGAT